MRSIRWLLPLTFLLLTLVPSQAGHSPPKIFLRVYVQTTGGETMSTQMAMTVTLPTTGETLQVRTLPVVSERNLIGIKAEPDKVRLFFDHEGQVSLDAVTAENQDRTLVLMIDGIVTYAPTIDMQISTGELDIPHPLSQQIIDLLQEVVRKNVREGSRN